MRRSRQSKRRLKSIFIMVLLTALLSIASTYAWFSANREVSLTGITTRVSAAEGLQISLDGETWGSSVAITQANLQAVVDAVTTANNGLDVAAQEALPVFSWPTELTPVSTDGTQTSGRLNLRYGDVNATGDELTGVATENDNATTKYISFDMYLKNSSSNEATGDLLQLSSGSNVTINATDGKEGTGLENSIRIGFIVYGTTAPMTADGKTVRTLAAGAAPKVAIWEPNNNLHIAEVVRNDRRIATATEVFATQGLTLAAPGTVLQVDTTDGTYYNAVATTTPPIVIGDENPGLDAPATIRTSGTLATVTDLIDVDSTIDVTAPTTPTLNTISMGANKILKVRVYIWLEGQDPDCNDTASTGKAIDVAINLTKPAANP